MSSGRVPAHRIVAGLILAGLSCLAAAGCGGGTGELTGTVTYQDKPLRQGTVLVAAGDGSTQSGVIRDDGSYTVTNVPAGPVKLAVTSPDPRAVKVAQRKKDEKPPPPDTSKWFAIPDKYADPAKSGLATTVKSGRNPFNIELK